MNSMPNMRVLTTRRRSSDVEAELDYVALSMRICVAAGPGFDRSQINYLTRG
jgi:hypothetical protein